ncbi:MAG: DUF547 domain-containing protein, partial [Cytophagales bacterium]|nr:DUF547 domain-containing protein [Cytophagales bacterium]
LFRSIAAPLLTEAQSKPPSHEIFDRLLKKNVTADGRVNYKAFIKDSVELNKYLAILSGTPPDEKTWSKNEQMVFWINAYNAFTIKLITKYYPLKSIKDIGTGIQIPFVNTPWTVRFFKIGNDRMDLDNIEHGRLRKKFDDPRVHMALVCASKSCPILLNEAYDAKRMDEQLAKQATAFLADPFRNKMSADKPQLSMLFKWYGGDFNKNGGSVRGFINAHSRIKIKSDAKISYLDYDWGLNEQ